MICLLHICLQLLSLTYQTKQNMTNQKLASISEYQTKEYIFDLIEQIKDALNDNDFEQIQNLSEMIVRECNEFID